ncbi:saccharopine dehydrogenase C-terminal domain-containing protein [Adhaeribacter radiodurans]|uniref:Saccharopine dehydrogenase NADP-binding domain-containing protein n=1 Tax=Adhaeribacter radiodurans TaxID=2745197 RepID=A0A7L7L5A5_9BACT|nr:saccharopine dehydrogenase C-terminal domain-containing protein [Adhaeribacter radiodurans]QMU27960.1 saccharopine dehydrogenase NADP-binding domain-containing protein [Adhaeribacter radiodurans]
MKQILILGAGRSSVYLIEYLIEQAPVQNWQITIADLQTQPLQSRLNPFTFVSLLNINIHNQEHLNNQVQLADLVISLLPAAFHLIIAQTCLELGKHFLTASYVTPELKALHEAAQQKNLLFLMETGLDPGIDHMSAVAAIAKIRQQGGELYSFKSYTGGLVAPESDTNPWHYKISWNPRNVVLAGQSTARFLQDNSPKYIPYSQLFRRTEKIEVAGLGLMEGYANRDSLSYQEAYGLESISTLIRGTLRWPGFCGAWRQLINLGLTDDSYSLPLSGNSTFFQWLESYLPASYQNVPLLNRLADYLDLPENSAEIQAIQYLGLLEEEPIGLVNATPARVLEQRLIQKLPLQAEDKDLVVMQHEFEFMLANKQRRLRSALVVVGENATYTAMAKTVGLPLGLAASLLLQNKITLTGVQIPTHPEIYEPILKGLEKLGINFTEQEEVL